MRKTLHAVREPQGVRAVGQGTRAVRTCCMPFMSCRDWQAKL